MRAHVIKKEDLEITEIRPGLFGTVIECDQVTGVRWEFSPGTGPTGMHSHELHEQVGLVVEGEIEIQIGDKMYQLRAGDIFWMPRTVDHGRTRVLGDQKAVVIDFFSPPRDEYVNTAHGAPPTDPTKA